MKNQWGRKKRLKNLRASKQKRPAPCMVAACAGGDGINEDREIDSIIEQVMKELANGERVRFLITDDGDLSIEGESCGIFLGKGLLKGVDL